MKQTRHTTDQIIEKLRQADVALGKGQKVPEIDTHAIDDFASVFGNDVEEIEDDFR